MFRFTIRELVLLTLVVAMGFAWWIDRRSINANASIWHRRANAAADVLTQRGWIVKWKQAEATFELPGASSYSYPNSEGYWYRNIDAVHASDQFN